MSLPDSWLKCNNCDETYTTDVLAGRFFYELQDGTQVPVERKCGWCHDCESFEAVEDLDPAVVIKQIETLRDKRKEHSGLLKYFSAEHKRRLCKIDTDISLLERLKVYLVEREAPSNCLNCGGDSISYMPELMKNWRHPGCGGAFSVETGDIFFSDVYPLRIYNEEGLLIRQVDDW